MQNSERHRSIDSASQFAKEATNSTHYLGIHLAGFLLKLHHFSSSPYTYLDPTHIHLLEVVTVTLQSNGDSSYNITILTVPVWFVDLLCLGIAVTISVDLQVPE